MSVTLVELHFAFNRAPVSVNVAEIRYFVKKYDGNTAIEKGTAIYFKRPVSEIFVTESYETVKRLVEEATNDSPSD